MGDLGFEHSAEEAGQGPAYAILRVPTACVPTSHLLSEEESEGGAPGVACKQLFPTSTLSRASFRSASLFPVQETAGSPQSDGSGGPGDPDAGEPAVEAAVGEAAADKPTAGEAAAAEGSPLAGSLQRPGSAHPTTARPGSARAEPDDEEREGYFPGCGSRPVILTQDQIPQQVHHGCRARSVFFLQGPLQGPEGNDAAGQGAGVQLKAQRVGRASGGDSGASADALEGQGSTLFCGGRAESPEPAEYEEDFHEGGGEGEDGSEAYTKESAAQQGRRASSAATSRSPSRLGQYIRPSLGEVARPGSAHSVPASGGRQRPPLEDRIVQQMACHPAGWSVYEVCDWLEFIGLGQYRKRMVHHCISGELLLRLTPKQLKVEIGIGPLGHREGLLRAIEDLEDHYNNGGSSPGQRGAPSRSGGSEDGALGINAGSSGPSSPFFKPSPSRASSADYRVMRAYEQRQKLMKDLQKAEAREAQRRRVTEDAMRTMELATEEVRKLKAAIVELDKQMGWSGAQLFSLSETLDASGALPWHPVGQFPAASPGRQQGSSGSGGPRMSATSRRIMEGQATTFLQRLQTDINSRQAKLAGARRNPPSLAFLAGGQAAERLQEAKDVKLVRDLVAGKNDELFQLLSSDNGAQVEQGLDEAAEAYQSEYSLQEEQVAAVKRAHGVAAKAARLAGYIRTALFMARLQEDLASREERHKELQKQWLLLEAGNTPSQQEEQDARKAKEMFALLGWPEVESIKPGDATSPYDDLLGGLLNRVWALKQAGAQGKDPDWGMFKKDGLNDMQDRKCAQLQAAAEEYKRRQEAREAERQAAVRAGKKQPLKAAKPAPPPVPPVRNYLQETVQLLAQCREEEVEMLEKLAGYKKFVLTYRAVRAMKFVQFTREDMAQRKQKAEALVQQLYPPNRKVLPKEQFEAFQERLMEDTQRRLANKAEIAEKARQEALAKLTKTKPAPRRRPASAHV